MADWAVFTGDIVKSTRMTSEELTRIFKGLQHAADLISEWQGMPAHLTRFRGDGWQLVVTPQLAFRAAVAIRAAVRHAGKGFSSRIGIAIGAGRITGADLSGAEGDAFVRSGRALDGMKRSPLMVADGAPPSLRAALPLADHILGGWTPRQAEIALALLPPDPPTQADLAERFGLTQQAIQKQAEASGVLLLIETCDVLEAEGVAAA